MSRHSKAGSVSSRDSRRSHHASGDATKGSSSSSRQSKEAEFFNECRVAYMAVVRDPQEGVTSKEQLEQGRGPRVILVCG